MMNGPNDPRPADANPPPPNAEPARAPESASHPTDPAAPAAKINEQEARNWGVFCHLAGLAGFLMIPAANVLGPLIIWLIKRDQHPLIDRHGKEALNFQISVLIYALVSGVLTIILIGILLLIALAVFWLVAMVIAAVKTSRGEEYRYPLTIRLIG